MVLQPNNETHTMSLADSAATTHRVVIRVGCDLVMECPTDTVALLTVRPLPDQHRPVREERLEFDDFVEPQMFNDYFGNIVHRVNFRQGTNHVRHDALIEVPLLSDKADSIGDPTPLELIPPQLLRYTLPSRYCESDKLLDLSSREFGHIADPGRRAAAICDWVHENLEYRFGSGRPDISAFEIIERGYGVCRDFAHCTVALCRSMNLPARYVTGHLPDIGYMDPGTPMDFHAYAEVYIGGKWHTFDARYNVPRIGRVKIAHGLDATDCAFATTYGPARLNNFDVWAYQVEPEEVSLDDPVDLGKRLDGTPEIRLSGSAILRG
jgi:transglutaminase-like putative cysteine protease